MNLNYLLKALSRRKLLLILIPIITLIIAFFLTTNLKDQFKSRAQLSTGFTDVETTKIKDTKMDESVSDARFNNVLETLSSPKVIGYLGYSLAIHDLTQPLPFTSLTAKQKQDSIYKRVNSVEASQSYKTHLDSLSLLNSYLPKEKNLIEYLKLYKYDYKNLTEKVLTINRVGHTDFIDISAITDNPEESAFMVNELCKQFLRFYNTDQSKKNVASLEAIGNLVKAKRLRLLRVTDSLMNYKNSHGVVNIDIETKSKGDLIKEYTGQLTEQQQANTEARIELQNVNKQLREMDGNPTELNKPAITTNNNSDIIDLQNKLASLRTQQSLHTGNPDKIAAQIQDVTKQLTDKLSAHRDPGGDVIATGVTEHDRLVSRKNDLEVKVAASDQSISDYQNKIMQLTSSYAQYATKEAANNSMVHEVEIATQDLKDAEEKYNQATNSKFAQNEDIKQSLFGQPAVEHEPSKRWLIVGVAAASSLLLCVFIIILLEYLDASIKTPFMFSKEVGLPLLGVINKVNLKKESLEQLLVQGGPDTEKVNPEFKDFLKKIRYEMDKKNSKLFLFTSNKPGEGKTTIITALAMVLASINKRILLIDTNFSHNSLTQLFGSTLALEDFGNLDFDEHYEVINKMIGKTSNKNIDIIGCKGGNYSPSEIFLKRGFFSALSKLTIYYDYIFLEGANLNQYADSKELAEFSDSVISVFSANSIIKQSDLNSITFLKDLKESFGGAILNNVELENIDF